MTDVMRKSNCSSCKAPIFFVKTQNGNWMPMDRDGKMMIVLHGEYAKMQMCYTPHWATCPDADKFKKPKKKKGK